MTKIRLAQYGGYIFLVRTVMTPRQVTLVQDTFRHVGRQAHEAGRIFYDELFLRAPELERLFTGDMARQKLKFVQMLSAIVKSLDQIAAISEDVVDLGRRHLSYDIEDEHYEAMGDALMGMLNRVLGAEMTPDIGEAWAAAYDMIAGVMMESSTASHSAEGFYAAIIRSVMASQYGPSVGADKAVPGRAPVTQGIDRGGGGGQVIRLS